MSSTLGDLLREVAEPGAKARAAYGPPAEIDGGAAGRGAPTTGSALLWSGGRTRRAVGEERMSWGALDLLYLGLKRRRGDEWRRPRLACTGPRTKQYQRLRRVNPAERSVVGQSEIPRH